jgi:glutaredoxin 3
MPPIEIYTKPYCPYCADAKELLRTKGAEFKEIVASGDPALRAELIQRSGGGMTYPQIFDAAGGLDPLLAGAAA